MNMYRCSNNGVGLVLTCGPASVSGLVPGAGSSVMFTNPNAVTINVVWGDSLPLTATSAGYPILAGTKESIDIATGTLYVAAICPGGTGPLHIHRGYEYDPD